MTGPAATHGLWVDLHRPNLSSADDDFSVIGVSYNSTASSRKGGILAFRMDYDG